MDQPPPDSQATPQDAFSTIDPLESIDPERSQLLETVAPSASEASDFDLVATLGDEERSQIDAICQSFAAAWESGDSEPDIASFVPRQIEESLRLAIVRELVLLDIAQRTRNKSLEPTAYLSAIPDCRSAVESALSEGRSKTPRGFGSLTVPMSASRGGAAGDRRRDSRYRPTKFHARGGLGAVYQAHDEELRRVVALKEVLSEHAGNPRVREKFVFEAEVTGSLEHPGIVPIYGLGRYTDDKPYYAMRFIQGESFRKTIEQFHNRHPAPTAAIYYDREFRSLLRRLIDACNAIHYAHEHGVLHRDIKPDNIMVGNYGETLVVDWGLAKLMQSGDRESDTPTGLPKIHPSSSRTNTVAGSAVGTPIYMSPEQAHGRHEELDGRTDIYSLGAVLFNIASGAYPVEGKSVIEVVQNVRKGNVRSLIDVCPRAPRPLDSICRKAMATDPDERYRTAVELADDIDRWMNDDVVQAHIGHETATERAGRLIRRYRSWTISGAVALLTITVVALVAAVLINSAKKKEEVAKDLAREAREDAVARYQDSRSAIDTWLVQSSDALAFFPGAQSVRQRLLQLATEDYERLSSIDSRDPELELERGRALVKLGDLLQLQEDYPGAMEKYALAQRVLATKIDDDTLNQAFRVEHANVHTRFGLALAAQQQPTEAEQQFQLAIRGLEPLASDSDPDAIRLLAVAFVNDGELAIDLGDRERAVKQLELAVEQYQRVASTERRAALGLARAYELLGRISIDRGMHPEAISIFNDAVKVLVPLVESEPDHPEYLDALASLYISEASSFRVRGLEQPLADSLEQALGYYRALDLAMPDLPRYRENLAITLIDLGLARHESGQNPAAEPLLDEARSVLSELTSRYGTVARFRQRLGACLDALGQVQMERYQDVNQAATNLANAAVTYDELTKTGADEPGNFQRMAVALSHYAAALDRQGMHEQSATNFQQAIAILQELIQIDGALPEYQHALAIVHLRYAETLHARQDETSLQQYQLSIDRLNQIEQRPASYDNDLARLLATCPHSELVDLGAASELAQQAVALAPGNPHFLATAALVALLQGDIARANERLNESKAERGSWIDSDLFVLAMVQHANGETDAASDTMAAAADWMQQNRPFNPDMLRMKAIASQSLANKAN